MSLLKKRVKDNADSLLMFIGFVLVVAVFAFYGFVAANPWITSIGQ